MAWTAPMVWTTATLTSAQLNQQLSANMNETAVAKATTAGSIFVGNGLNKLVERIPMEDIQYALETTTNTSYANLATTGGTVTVDTGTQALVGVTSDLNNNTAGAASFVSWAIYDNAFTPYTTPDDNFALWAKCEAGPTVTSMARASSFRLSTGITAAVGNVFRMKYRVSAGTGTFNERAILVIPL